MVKVKLTKILYISIQVKTCCCQVKTLIILETKNPNNPKFDSFQYV